MRENLQNHPRLFGKISLAWRAAKKFFIWLRLSGARCISIDEYGNGVLVLNRKSPLGMRGDWVCTPQDETIFKYVIEHGEWEIEESQFLADQISRVEKTQEGTPEIAFIDIGANSGLITRQVLNLSKSDCDVVLVEPIPNHIKAIQANLKEFSQKNNLRIVEAALAGSTGELEIRIENSNRGNSSFLASAIPASEFLRLNVRTISVQDFVKNHIPNADYFVLKSDVQGYDSKILGLLPSELWEKCVAAVVEVWALREIEPLEVENLLILWRNFSSVSWTADRDRLATLEEVHDFWLGKSGKSRNLYLSQ